MCEIKLWDAGNMLSWRLQSLEMSDLRFMVISRMMRYFWMRSIELSRVYLVLIGLKLSISLNSRHDENERCLDTTQ